MTSAQLRASTVVPVATTPVVVECVGGERLPITGWRLEGCPRGDTDSEPPKEPSPHVLVLELGTYQESQ